MDPPVLRLNDRISQSNFAPPPASSTVCGAGWDFSKIAAALSTPRRKISCDFFRPPPSASSGLRRRVPRKSREL